MCTSLLPAVVVLVLNRASLKHPAQTIEMQNKLIATGGGRGWGEEAGSLFVRYLLGLILAVWPVGNHPQPQPVIAPWSSPP